MRALALLLVAGLALGQSEDYFRPTQCSCQRRSDDCFDSFSSEGRYSYFYETSVEHWIPGYAGKAEFKLSAAVDFTFYTGSCVAELSVYNITAFDSSWRYNSSRDDFFTFYRQKALVNGERELFYKYNESLPRYRFYFCFSGGNIGEVYPHRDEPTWSVNFKRGILSTFQARFCPTKGRYTASETSVEGYYCPYEYTYNIYGSRYGNFSAYKDLQYDKCHYRPSYYSSSFFGNTFREGERPLSVSSQTYYRYYYNTVQRIQYQERYQFRLRGFTFQGQDYGSMNSYVYQEFRFRERATGEEYRTFRGLPREYYSEEPRSMLYEFTDQYYMSHYLEGDKDKIFQLVYDITSYRRQSYQGEFLDKFHELQQRLRYISFEDYKTLYNRFYTDSRCRAFESNGFYSCRRTFFESFVTTGSDAAAQFFRYLVYEHQDFFGRDDQLFSMWAFLYNERTSGHYLQAVHDTCKRYDSDDYFWGKCALILSSLSGKYCQQYDCQYIDYNTFDMSDDSQKFDSIFGYVFKYFYGEFYRSRGTYTYRSFVAFRSLGNFVRGTRFSERFYRSFYKFFYDVAFDQGFQYPSEYRLAAFEYFSYTARYFYSEVYNELYKYYYDESQPTEYRIAAFNGIIYSFKYGYYQYSEYWRSLFQVLKQTRDEQFYCYTSSYLYRLYESDYFPDRYWASSISFYFRNYGFYYSGRLYRCRNYGHFASQVQQYTYSPSYFFKGAPDNFFGGRLQSSVEYKRSQSWYQFPERFNYRFDGFFYNQEYQPFEFGFQSKDWRKMFEYFSAPDGFFFRTGDRTSRGLNQFKFSFFFRMFEYELFFEEFSGDYIERTFERELEAYKTYQSFYRLFQDGFSYSTFTDLLYRLKKFNGYSGAFRFLTDRTWYDQVYNFDKTFRAFDYQYAIPTRMGFPLVYNLTSYMHFRMYLNGEIGCDETCRYSYGLVPDRVTSRATFKPRFATRFFGSVSLYTQYFAPSLQWEFTGYGGFEQLMNATFRDGSITFDYSVPQSYQQIGSFSSKVYTYYYRYQRPYRHYEYSGVPAYTDFHEDDYLQPSALYYNSERCENCSWYYDFYDYTGSNFTYSLTYPNATYYYNAPSFPFSGFFNFTFGVTPRRFYRGQYITDQQLSYIYRRQRYSRFMFTFENRGDVWYYNGSFYPPSYGYEPYTTPTYRFFVTRSPYFDEYSYRYYNFSFYGQRYTQVNGYYYPYWPTTGYFEGFRGYFTYRDFEGSFYDWFARSYFNSTGFLSYESPCSRFNWTFRGDSQSYYFFSSWFRFYRQKYYSFLNHAYYNNRIGYSNFTFNWEGDEYFGFFNSERRYFMNDMVFDLTNFFPYGRYSYTPINFFAILPAFYQEGCHAFDKAYVTFDGYKYSYNTLCKHYMIHNEEFKVLRIPRDTFYAIEVRFADRYNNLKFFFEDTYFNYGGKRYYTSDYTEGQDYDMGEFVFRRFYASRCNNYQIFFKRFHLTIYYSKFGSSFYMSPSYYGNTGGICGNMNGYAGDDTYMLGMRHKTTNVRDFFSSWTYRHQSERCSAYSYVSPVDKGDSRYRQAKYICQNTYTRLFSHCFGRVDPESFLERCIATYIGCEYDTDKCLEPVLCAYSSACYNYGYYPQNSCIYSDWSKNEFSLRYWRSYQPTWPSSYQTSFRSYLSQQFRFFSQEAPAFKSSFAPTVWPHRPYYYYSTNCTNTRLSEWYYDDRFATGYGFQWCQREDNQFTRYRYTISNFFYHRCENTGPRCCSRPYSSASSAYRTETINGVVCTSKERIPTCGEGYSAVERYERVATFTCPSLGEASYPIYYHRTCSQY